MGIGSHFYRADDEQFERMKHSELLIVYAVESTMYSVCDI